METLPQYRDGVFDLLAGYAALRGGGGPGGDVLRPVRTFLSLTLCSMILRVDPQKAETAWPLSDALQSLVEMLPPSPSQASDPDAGGGGGGGAGGGAWSAATLLDILTLLPEECRNTQMRLRRDHRATRKAECCNAAEAVYV